MKYWRECIISECSGNLNDNFSKLLWISVLFERTVSFAFTSILSIPEEHGLGLSVSSHKSTSPSARSLQPLVSPWLLVASKRATSQSFSHQFLWDEETDISKKKKAEQKNFLKERWKWKMSL